MADNQQYGPLAQKPESAKDIRRVVANATRTKGKGLTIANKDELNNRKQEEQIANNVNKGVSKGTAAPVSSSTPKVTLQPTQPQPIGPVKPNTDLFKNPQLGPINNIQVIKQDSQAQNIQNNNNGQDNFINTHGRATELKTPIDIDNALMDLYSDIKEKINRNELNNVNVQGLKQAYSEFTNMDDEVVTSLVSDIASMINKKLPFSVDNMKKLKSLYPELSSAAWGFDVGGGQNMYQGGGLKETLSSGSPTDLNKRGPVGVAAETVLNPLGQATTVLDSASQSIGQVDNNTDKILGWDIKSTPELKQALSKVVSDEKLLNKYYEEYQNYVKEHGVLSNLYTDFYEGDTLVEKLWNVARGKKKVNVDAGFKSWLVDKVNNQVNGWQGEFWGAANQLNDVQGPNVAKMYSNVPASTVKTATAITRAITNPVDTVSGLVHLIGTEEGHQALAARYGSWEAFANAIEQDPVGTSSDVLAVVEGGASATKAVATLGTKGALSASIATEMLGAARTSESLFKIASRLEKLSSKAGAIEKIAGTSSNLGVDIPLKGGMVQIGKDTKVINGIIKGLREWGESGDSMIKKVAKYSADRSEQGIGKIAKDTKDFLKEGPVNSLANKLMGTASDTDKLFKAANPNINTLRNTTDYKNKRANMDLATKTIVEAGYTPKTISEWAKAHAATLNKKWNEFKQLIKDKSDVEVDSSEVLHEIKDFIKREKEGATVNQRGDIRALELEVQDLERRGKLSMDVIENKKEHYNSSWKDSEKMKKGDIYEKGVKILGNSMRKVQDNILGKGPESTKALRQQIKALMDTKEDIYKADVRNQKKKSDIAGGGVVESYGRLSGLGDVIGGVVGGVLGGGGEGFAQAGKGLGKMILGKAMGKARDVDYLTKKGFEGLSKKNKKPSSEGLREKMQERRELSELRDKKKELDKKYKEGKISDDEYLKQSEEVEYGIAQKRARLSVVGDKEMKMDSKTRAKMVELVKKRAKDVGFATEVMDGMEKDTQGYTDLQKKLIALEKNPGDTTAQHELFHAFFSVVDNKTKTYILDEAKKILKEKGLSDINAEEWLAESFGIYAKRQQIKLGLIDAPKGFKAKLRDFFQRVYEFMQRFNGDRVTINKLFDEILGDRKMKNGIMDLSDLLGNKKVNERTLYGGRGEGLRNKSVYHGSSADFDKFDSSHMGEGEGNQAHGWGHYVAVDKKTAEKYAEMNTTQKLHTELTYKGKLNSLNPDNYAIKQLDNEYWLNYYDDVEGFKEDFPKIKENILKDSKRRLNMLLEDFTEEKSKKDIDNSRLENIKDSIRKLDAGIKELENMKAEDFGGKEVGGRQLYKNDIPDPVKKDTPTGSNYLEEDAKLTWEELKDFSKAYGEELKYSQIMELARDYKNRKGEMPNGKWLYETIGILEGMDKNRKLGYVIGQSEEQKAASKFLESIGYDGIHYYGGSDGEAYVIFNDDALKIKDHIRYKKKTDSEGRELSDRQLKYFGNSKVRNDKGELVPVYHFTADDFNTVDFKKGMQNMFWFTSDKNASDRAMGVRPGMQKKRKDMYVDIQNPAGWDEYNKFGTDELKARGYDGVILKEKDGSFEGFIWDKENQVKYVDNQNPTRASKDMRYKKKIGDKDVEITPEADSPEQLIEKNADGLSVMKSFISEKQAEKALNVNKVLLDKDGNPYLWTHTNKYNAPQFANFENAKDSKYKEFGDYEIAWFSNSEDMSRSYANQESELADTKPIKSIEEFNDRFSKYDIDGEPYDTEWHKGGDDKEWKYGHRTSIDKEGGEYVINQYDSESHKYKSLESLYDNWHNGGYDGQGEKEVIDGVKKLVHEQFIDDPNFHLYDDVEIKKEKDGYVVTTSAKKELGRYKSEQDALAKGTAMKHVSGKYHYQGIITDIKNPLVVDLGKYKPGEIKRFRDGDKIVGEHGRYWSDLGNAYEFVKKEQPNVDEIFSKVEKEWGGAKKASNDIKYYAFDIEREGDNLYKAYKDMEEGTAKKFAEDRLMAYRKAGDIIGYISRGVVDELKPEWRNLRVESDGKTTTIGNLYDKAISEYNKYKDVFDVFGEGNRIWKESGKYSQPEGYDKSKTKNFINLLKKNGMGEGAISILHGTDLMNRIDLVYSPFASEGWAITKLRDKSLQTNDYVFYALRKGGYDGVLFKDIVDYGGKGDNKGGDVLAAFKSSDFKAWDNANPTDSKYISYKKKVSLDKKPEGLSKKDSNGLLAKGRERTLGNNGIRYKTNISEKDSSGKKLSEGQKKFFAGSKVVDKDGNLLRVYHGTLAGDFTVFQKYGNRASNNIASDVGFWFTPNKKGAINFAKESSWRGDNRARAEEVYLDIKNPKIYEPSEFNLKDYEERDKLIDSKYKEVYAARNEMNKYDYNYFWMGEYTHGNHVNRGIFNKLDYIYNQKGKITEADLKDIKEEYSKINWNGYYKPGIDATYEDFKNYLQAKKKYDKLNDEYLEMKHSDSYDDFKADIYKLDNKKRDKLDYALDDMDAAKKYIDNLKKEGYDGIIIKGTEYDGATLGEGARNDQYVAFDSNQIKRITNENPTKNEDIRFKKGYHGSKADFDRFDSSHMGEGEGNQAHGYGHYIAATKKTAKGYAQMGGNPRLSFKGLNRDELADRLIDAKLDGKEFPDGIANAIITRIEDDGLTFKEAKKEAINTFNNIAEEYKANGEMDKFNQTKEEIKTLEGLQRKEFEMKKGRNLYTVEIPDSKKANTPSGENYLNEEKAYGKNVYEKIFEEARKNKGWTNEKGADWYINDRLQFNGKGKMYGVWINKALEAGFGNDKKAVAKFLEGLGYDGIEYKGLQDGKAYVIFKDNDIDIKDHIRYKKGLEKKADDGIRYKGNSLPVHKLGDVGLENEYGLKKIEGLKPYKLANGTRQEMEKGLNKIMRNLRNDAVAGGVVPGNYTKGTPIENALNSLRKINWDKENIEDIETLRGVWRGKDYSIAQIIKLIDSGNGDGMKYKWYWDKKEGMPTVIFWKGNQYKAIGDRKYWAFHTNKNNITSPTMKSSLNSKGKLRLSPLRR